MWEPDEGHDHNRIRDYDNFSIKLIYALTHFNKEVDREGDSAGRHEGVDGPKPILVMLDQFFSLFASFLYVDGSHD